jgi:tetratricopeptide (TPR) repeat protein
MVNPLRIHLLALGLSLVVCSCSAPDPPRDRADEALQQAQDLADEGKYEEALQKHIWYHDHALEVNPDLHGVRLSFALSDWVELGEKYPRALDVLKNVRDQKSARLLAGEADRELFHDVESINDRLGASPATADLFKKIDAANPGFASSIYDLAEESLVEAGEYALAGKHLGDPAERFARIRSLLTEHLALSEDEITRTIAEEIFTERVSRLVTVLDKTGDRQRAREIQAQALRVLDSQEIRSLIPGSSSI